MGKASSSKKVARAARAGGRRKVRSNQGLLFPVALGVVVLLGIGLIFYARHENQTAATIHPVLGDHWHAAYGVYNCTAFLPAFSKGADPNAADPLGIHSHGDGVIHIHPFSSETAGKNAKLGKYLDWEGVKLTTDELVIPGGPTLKNGDKCPDGKPGNLKVLVWDHVQTDTGAPKVFVTDFDNIRFLNDGMGITIAFVPDDADLTKLKPPTAANLAALGSADSSTPLPSTTVPGAAGAPAVTTVPGATTVPAATTAPAATAPPTTAASPTATT